MTKDKSGPAFIEPFGYFKCEPFGWSDCADTDECAIPLYERATVMEMQAQRDALLVALEYCIKQVPEFSDVPGIASAIQQVRSKE